MNYTPTLEMDRSTWLKERQKYIGSSDAGGVLGLSKFKSEYDVWLDKTSDEPVEIEDNPRMEWGRRLEDVVAEAWSEKSGMAIRKDNKIRVTGYLSCNLDRTIVAIDERGPGVLEVKTADYWTKDQWSDGVPLYYYAQVQHQMYVTGYNWGEFAVLFGGNDFQRYEFIRDEQWVETMIHSYMTFWEYYVTKRIAPPARTESDVKHLYPGEDGLVAYADEDLQLLFDDALFAKDGEAVAKILKDDCYLGLKIAMGNAEKLIDADGKVLATYSGKNGSRRLNLK